MNIALLIERLDGGGSERLVRRLAEGLARDGQRVYVYCLHTSDLPRAEAPVAGVVIREARSFGRDPVLAWRLGRWLVQDRIDLVHAHSCAALIWALPAVRLLRLPLVHVWHGWPLGRPTRDHGLAEWLDRFADRVIINSESLRARLSAGRIARAAICVRNGIDLPLIAPADARRRLERLCGLPLSDPLVLSVGNLRAEKDIVGLLRAFAGLRRERPDAQLVCIGAVWDQEYWQTVQRTVAELALRESVRFPGPYRDAWRLMAGADVLCLSSCSESMPNVVLEAMSQRVPVVATAVGDVGRLGASHEPERWLLRHNVTGLLVPPGEPAALATALSDALGDSVAAGQRAAQAYEDYRQHFTTESMVRRYEQIYEECHRARRRPSRARDQRPAVLMLGPAPPQVGGMVTSIGLLMEGPLRARYALRRFATTGGDSRRGSDTALARASRVLTAPFRYGYALVRLAVTIVYHRIDLVHIHTCSYFTCYRNLLDLAVAKVLGRAVVLHIRGGQFERFCAGAGPLGRRIIRLGAEAADAVVVLSDHWRTALQAHLGRASLHVIPNAVEVAPTTAPAAPARRACRFLYLANLTHAKGLADLIAAAACLRESGAAFELHIAGPAVAQSQAVWEQRVRDAGLADCTTFCGLVTGAAKAQCLAQADCFVHPSHSEGLPNAILEAAAAGLPVIATTVGSIPELFAPIIGELSPGPLVPPHDRAALAAALRRVATDGPYRRRLGRALRRHVAARYSLASVSQRIDEVYRTVLAQRRTGPGRATAAISPTENIPAAVPPPDSTRGPRTQSQPAPVLVEVTTP